MVGVVGVVGLVGVVVDFFGRMIGLGFCGGTFGISCNTFVYISSINGFYKFLNI